LQALISNDKQQLSGWRRKLRFTQGAQLGGDAATDRGEARYIPGTGLRNILACILLGVGQINAAHKLPFSYLLNLCAKNAFVRS